MIPLPDKKYSIIYADPPWSYQNRGTRAAASKHYDTMTIEDIKRMGVGAAGGGIANEDCVLFMWATFPMLREALDVIEAWGFSYKTVAFNWVKQFLSTPSARRATRLPRGKHPGDPEGLPRKLETARDRILPREADPLHRVPRGPEGQGTGRPAGGASDAPLSREVPRALQGPRADRLRPRKPLAAPRRRRLPE